MKGNYGEYNHSCENVVDACGLRNDLDDVSELAKELREGFSTATKISEFIEYLEKFLRWDGVSGRIKAYVLWEYFMNAIQKANNSSLEPVVDAGFKGVFDIK